MAILDHVTVASTCALACKSWHRVSRDKLLWRSLLARDFSRTEWSLREAAGDEVSWISGKDQDGCTRVNSVVILDRHSLQGGECTTLFRESMLSIHRETPLRVPKNGGRGACRVGADIDRARRRGAPRGLLSRRKANILVLEGPPRHHLEPPLRGRPLHRALQGGPIEFYTRFKELCGFTDLFNFAMYQRILQFPV